MDHRKPTDKYSRVDFSCSGPDLLEQMINEQKKMATAVISASMTIIGNPVIVLGDTVEVRVFTREGNYHHTSGLYFVSGVTDNITGGSYTTELALVRNNGIVGSPLKKAKSRWNPEYVSYGRGANSREASFNEVIRAWRRKDQEFSGSNMGFNWALSSWHS